ncbi:MAG: nucleotidyltransferase domain-containing protein [Rhodoferax sp.]
MKYGLPERTIAQISAVLAQHSAERAVLYGSRAKGNYKPGSDIDLTLYGSGLTPQLCATIAESLDDLLLPYTFDLSVFAELKHPELEAHIQRVGVVFYERQDRGL